MPIHRCRFSNRTIVRNFSTEFPQKGVAQKIYKQTKTPKFMKTAIAYSQSHRRKLIRNGATALVLALLGTATGPAVLAQDPCPEVTVLASGLLSPSKLIQTPLGNFLVSQNGTGAPNTGRISIVDPEGNERTLLDGLPSGIDHTGGRSGTSALWLRGRTLFVVNGLGDVTLPGPLPGTEIPN